MTATTTTSTKQQKQKQHQSQQRASVQREELQQPTLFRPRLSADDLRALLDSASETHQNYRNGSLLRSSSSVSSLLLRASSSSASLSESRKTISPTSIATTRSTSSSSLRLPPRVPISPAAAASPHLAPPSSTISLQASPTSPIVSDNSSTRPRLALRLRNKILQSVTVNRLTIIVGATGSGKSTQIPPLLLELKGAVLCTQPRRLAVVAIAKRVSSELNVTLGGAKVGYHVGNCNLSTSKTQLLITTAGILLEELRANGSDALKRFRVLVIDECHERSPESDLILSLVKLYLQKHPKSQLRLVLMSATFAHNRYKDYFRTTVPGCEVVDTIALESASQAFSTTVKTYYLDDILPHLPPHHANFGRQMRLNPDKDLQSKLLSQNMLKLISSLVSWLDANEAPMAPFILFAPTYRHLEQLHDQLSSNANDLRISVLHSSIDMDDCLRSMQGNETTTTTTTTTASSADGNISSLSGATTTTVTMTNRRILLASAIADSSVTVPGVSCVIDMCRSLQVQWTGDHVAQTVWASKSICDQRRGRTGRTCPGRCFRLLYKGFYLSQRLPQWDVPQLTLSSCLNEVLGLVCSKPHDLVDAHDPRQVLERCLDPPNSKVVESAIQYLQEMGAVQLMAQSKKQKKKLLSSLLLSPSPAEPTKVVPTNYGEILAALPLNVSDAKVVLAGGQMGLLHETLALRAIYNHKPSPIVHKFGSPEENTAVLESFYSKATSNGGCYLAHLAAYMYWDYEWNCKRRKQANRDFWERSSNSSPQDASEWESLKVWKWTPELEEDHIAWCKDHDINPTSVRSIAEIVENTMNALFLSKFEPAWLRCADPTPLWIRPRDWHGTVGIGRDMLHRVYDNVSMVCNVLMALLENRLPAASTLVNQMMCLEIGSSSSRLACIHFLQGTCIYGDRCRDSHDPSATRPFCRYGKVCSKGEKCLYSHKNLETDNTVGDDEGGSDYKNTAVTPAIEGGEKLLTAKLPLLPYLSIAGGPSEWFQHHHQRVLMLGEGNFKFTDALTQLGMPPFLSSTNTSAAESNSTTTGTLSSVDATRLHLDDRILCQVGRLDTFAWNFPYVAGHDEDPIIHEALLLETFHSLALLLFQCDFLEYFTFAVALQADQLSRWNMVQCAWKTGWRLQAWSTFDHTVFPGYFPSRHAGESFPVEEARFYVFMLHKSDVGAVVTNTSASAATEGAAPFVPATASDS